MQSGDFYGLYTPNRLYWSHTVSINAYFPVAINALIKYMNPALPVTEAEVSMHAWHCCDRSHHPFSSQQKAQSPETQRSWTRVVKRSASIH